QPRESAVQTLRAGALDELVQLLALRQAGEQRARRLLRQHQGDMIERGELRFGIGSRRLRDFDRSEIGKIDHSGCLDPCWANPDHSAARRGTIQDRARIVAGAPWEFTGKALNFRVSFDRGGVMASARPLPTFIAAADDVDPEETQEWLESIDSVLRVHGAERAHYLLECMIDHARRSGAYLPYKPNTAYLNTIPVGQQPPYPGDRAIERRIEAYLRWNAMAMVVQANRKSSEYGGHIASYASSATLYEVGFNHFWRAPSEDHGGDLVFFQGHSSPGIYARAYLEGRLTEENLDHFRPAVVGPGLTSYPHPWLMPEFWQFPTVSMGLGPLMAIYQARFMRYMEHREILPAQDRKVWCFIGDGETDEPESMGAITMPVREKLDNLIFVINCNLQRLDGPVRGNGKIIQELEAAYQGAGWNVIKVIWGSRWDPLLARDTNGILRRVMMECVDG